MLMLLFCWTTRVRKTPLTPHFRVVLFDILGRLAISCVVLKALCLISRIYVLEFTSM